MKLILKNSTPTLYLEYFTTNRISLTTDVNKAAVFASYYREHIYYEEDDLTECYKSNREQVDSLKELFPQFTWECLLGPGEYLTESIRRTVSVDNWGEYSRDDNWFDEW